MQSEQLLLITPFFLIFKTHSMGLLSQAFIAINRLDLAENQVKGMAMKEDDSSITLLASARINLAIVITNKKFLFKQKSLLLISILFTLFTHFAFI